MSRSDWYMPREARRRAVLEQVRAGADTVEAIWVGINWWTKATVREVIRDLIAHGRLKMIDEVLE